MDLVQFLGNAVRLIVGETTINISIFEDNAGALVLAETLPPQFTSRSKHYTIKIICFCKGIIKRNIRLYKIDALEQIGDLFLKGLSSKAFEYLRKKLMGDKHALERRCCCWFHMELVLGKLSR